MARIVLFDLDDTLMDQQSAARDAVLGWADELGLDVESPDDLVDAWVAVSDEAFGRFTRREISFQDQRRERVRGFLGVDAADDEADELFTGYLSRYEGAWRAFDDALPALRRVRAAGLRSAILTNGDSAQQQRKLQVTRLADHVDAVVSSDQLPAGKPDPRSYAVACALLGAAPADVLMVGDHPTRDYLGPLAAGLDAVLLDRFGRHAGAGHRTVPTLDALTF